MFIFFVPQRLSEITITPKFKSQIWKAKLSPVIFFLVPAGDQMTSVFDPLPYLIMVLLRKM